MEPFLEEYLLSNPEHTRNTVKTHSLKTPVIIQSMCVNENHTSKTRQRTISEIHKKYVKIKTNNDL